MFSFWNRQQPEEPKSNPEEALVTLYSPRSPASEAYRMLRTNVQFSSGGDSLKVLEVTSTFPGEGKSLTSSNLAITFAQAGESVILIDADMRRSSIHDKFGLRLSPGLSECILTGNIDAVIKDGPVENLKIITAGTTPPNPSELIHSRHMDKLLEQLRFKADVVIIDAPPVLAVTDAALLATKSDGVLMVVNLKLSDKNANKRAKATLDGVNARVLGAVITGIDPPRVHHGYKYGYKNYYYDKSYGYYYDSGYSNADGNGGSTAGGKEMKP